MTKEELEYKETRAEAYKSGCRTYEEWGERYIKMKKEELETEVRRAIGVYAKACKIRQKARVALDRAYEALKGEEKLKDEAREAEEVYDKILRVRKRVYKIYDKADKIYNKVCKAREKVDVMWNSAYEVREKAVEALKREE